MENPSIMSHVSVGVADLKRSAAFYDAVLAVVGARRMFEHGGATIGYGRVFPEFWIGLPLDGRAPSAGNGAHFAFLARSREEVDAFWSAAQSNGGQGEGEPGPRPLYGPGYYACFLRDPDGNKIEAHSMDDASMAGVQQDEPEAHPT